MAEKSKELKESSSIKDTKTTKVAKKPATTSAKSSKTVTKTKIIKKPVAKTTESKKDAPKAKSKTTASASKETASDLKNAPKTEKVPKTKTAPKAKAATTSEPAKAKAATTSEASPKNKSHQIQEQADNIVAINDVESKEELLKLIESTVKPIKAGSVVVGTVVKIERDDVLVDFGYKSEGIVTIKELTHSYRGIRAEDVVQIGDEIEAVVINVSDRKGRLLLSKKQAVTEKAWAKIKTVMDGDGIITGKVIESVRGGLIVDIGLRGFLPSSLIEMYRIQDFEEYIGQDITVKIIDLDKARNNIVLSRRYLLEQEHRKEKEAIISELEVGQVRPGKISSIVEFGVFVDIGGMDGLVHLSEISWKRVANPNDVVEVGQDVMVQVTDINRDMERVSLSIRATQEDPWQPFAKEHAIGQIVKGEVSKVLPSGVIVSLSEYIDGFIYIHELTSNFLESPDKLFKAGDIVYTKITDIDLIRHRVVLSIRRANENLVLDGDESTFDPALYGMATEYNEDGTYKYPEGFDAATGKWLEGFDAQKKEWETKYAYARNAWENHKEVVKELNSKEELLGSSQGFNNSSSRAKTTKRSRKVRLGDDKDFQATNSKEDLTSTTANASSNSIADQLDSDTLESLKKISSESEKTNKED